jgi:hypothetical protein
MNHFKTARGNRRSWKGKAEGKKLARKVARQLSKAITREARAQ